MSLTADGSGLMAEDTANGVGGLCTDFHPMEGTFKIQIYCGRIGVGIVSTNFLSKFTITWCSCVGDDDPVECVVLASATL